MQHEDSMPDWGRELVLDGVRYADVAHTGETWRIGATVPTWRERLVPLGPQPDAQAMATLAGEGICLGRSSDGIPPLAVMCGGMGAMWPGMGRELYDNFPAARAAMDHIQSIANWDVLALLDEREPEKINATRWQIPYLFLVEYAQWAYLSSLGLRPALFCGHSLGELIALCCAGIYSPETAWYILDTRAMHVAEVEAKAPSEAAMMAVNADASVVEEVLRTWPELYVANYNTPNQSILGGPRAIVREARNSLRKRRIAAMMLNVSLTFHSPAMRVLRDLAVRRLSALEMHAAEIPVLSVVTTQPYPGDQAGIVRQIADLDENSVHWLDTVRAMWQHYGARHFLELGPQEILCGLVRDIEGEALCLACGRKGRETQGMRQACAHLYALGHLPRSVLASRAANCLAPVDDVDTEEGGEKPLAATAPADQGLPPWWEEEPSRVVLELLARACKCDVALLRPELDLRHDLALRSITFPFLLREAGDKLGREIQFEELVNVVTVGDLVATLTGHANAANKGEQESGEAGRHHGRQWPMPGLQRRNPQDRTILPFDPEGQGLPLRAGDTLAVHASGVAPEQVAKTLASLASLGLTLLLPDGVPTAFLRKAGSTCRLWQDSASLPDDMGTVDGLLWLCAGEEATNTDMDKFGTQLQTLHARGLRYGACVRFGSQLPVLAVGEIGENAVPVRYIDMEVGQTAPLDNEWADIVAQELLCGEVGHVLWSHAGVAQKKAEDMAEAGFGGSEANEAGAIVERRHSFSLVWPHTPATGRVQLPGTQPSSNGEGSGVGRYALACGFSAANDVLLASQPCLSVSRALQVLLEAGRMFLPWLGVAGFSDVHFRDWPQVAPGVVREGHVAVEARPWMLHDGAMTRLVSTRLSVRALAANGRHTGTWVPTTGATLLLGHSMPDLGTIDALQTDNGEDLLLDEAWEKLGIGPAGRLVHSLHAMDENVHVAHVEPSQEAIALGENSGYSQTLVLVEGILQAARCVLALEAADTATVWRPATVGYILLGQEGGPGGPWQIRLHRSWQDAGRQRFDATVVAADKTLVARLYHLECEPFAHW